MRAPDDGYTYTHIQRRCQERTERERPGRIIPTKHVTVTRARAHTHTHTDTHTHTLTMDESRFESHS